MPDQFPMFTRTLGRTQTGRDQVQRFPGFHDLGGGQGKTLGTRSARRGAEQGKRQRPGQRNVDVPTNLKEMLALIGGCLEEPIQPFNF